MRWSAGSAHRLLHGRGDFPRIRRRTMIRSAALAACDRLAWTILGIGIGIGASATVFTQATPPAPASQAQVAPPARVLTSDAGLVLNFIKPDKTKDFEAV